MFEDIKVQCCFTSTETVRTIRGGQFEDVPLVEFMYLVFIRVPGEMLPQATQVFAVVFV